jgi:Fur family ferric uptake transcriptional regulator
MTRQREAVVAALQACAEFRSAQEIHAALRSSGSSIGLTTVYRALAGLAERGEVDALRADDGETVYRRCRSSDHHHHLVCRECGRTVEVEGPAVERWADTVARAHGFTDVSHTVEVFGRCADCAGS